MNMSWVVLFDWDGTIINSLDLKIANAARLFHDALGIEPTKVATSYRWHSGIPRHQLFNAICADNGLPPLNPAQFQDLSQRFTELNLTVLTNPQNSAIVPRGTVKALKKLMEQKIPLYISSSATSQEIHHIAKSLNLESYFNEILGSSPGFSKGREHILHVKSKQKTTLDRIVFVGDEPTDIQLGKSAGVHTIAIIGTHPREELLNAKPDYIIQSMPELLNILDKSSLYFDHN